ncbi:Cobyrinic acid A,C-diamide synthase [Hartmannibacter diazotrophicus]|uniref:Hydrogenobyrinate a,c-diamide synthase n=1 Tax=Hartmannibacter diazotrophicus TaxID=1482074 RepID=A0A2C9D8K5_9HYPH|nr:cobyrinate a,c-diamide synthase [Hartmannibacter diazotrophicus]SON56606.1 Cobyrinic acid A,C-diamide synthase [Hartmannibacter diazotrophicus]
MTPPGFLIAAMKSGSGKTTLSLGLMRAFARRGVRVAPFKCGPDYIDPAFHRAATGRDSVNLDGWAMAPELRRHLFAENTAGADLVIGEALMGLFDGVPAPEGRSGASSDIAVSLGLPVLLVHDVSGQSQSAAAIVKGAMTYDPALRIAGVVLNRCGSERHVRLVRNAIEALGVPVFGALPRDTSVSLPERHLGLVQAGESADLEARLDAMADFVTANVDLDRIKAAATAGRLAAGDPASLISPPGRRIALAHDAAFSFIYPHLVAGWQAMGAEIRPFSPLADEPPPDDCDACWLPGGYPELHGETLAAATGFKTGLKRFAETRPVHGECGGYMVLGHTLTDADGRAHDMAGLLDLETSFAKRRMHLGYRRVELLADGVLGKAGARLNGHEFHYATIVSRGSDEPLSMVSDAYGNPPAPDGSRRGLVSGSFFHAIAKN